MLSGMWCESPPDGSEWLWFDAVATRMVGTMFIRRTQTRRTEDGKPYFSHRLVHAERLATIHAHRRLYGGGS